ncbi:MAG: hypothetical protein H0V47_05090, partial [Chloroflexia bacterium]|nr:hypothetical protein [Chloroflexia bacterium]
MGNFTSSPGNRSLSRRRLLKMSGAAAGGITLSSLYGSQLGLHAPRFGPRLTQAAPPANEHFQRTWERTDRPVVEGMVSRTWMWGPEAFTGAMTEPYAESPEEMRTVQYFDKARMEITHPDSGDPTSIWYVTNGLLVVELVSGRMQTGDNTFVDRTPAQVNVAGDGDDPTGPTYATFGPLLDAAPLAVNSAIVQRVDRAGNVTSDPALADQGILTGIVDDVTNHSIAAPFWEFMNSSGLVYENGSYSQDNLFENAYFATGRPISEPYWADVKVAGTVRLVLMQCFERRCMTYTPGNQPGWLVEAGNVGLHYYAWRYGDDPEPPPPPPPLGDFCVPVPEGYKPKTAPAAKLQKLAENSVAPSTLASMFFQLGRRYMAGHSPANELEVAAFEAFGNLPQATRDILQCSLEKIDDLAPEVRDQLFDPRFDLSDTAVNPEDLANTLALEIVMRASQTMFGDAECMTEERPGLARVSAGIDGEILFTPTIFRINDLRTIEFRLTLQQYESDELQQVCTVVPIDGDGDGVPDSSQLNCQTQMAPCPGHMIDNVCMRVPEVRAGEMVKLTGANYFNVAAKVRFQIGETTRDVEAHVCGDLETPLTETVDGSERVIRDNRVQDQLTFQVPMDLASGVYMIQVVVPNNTGTGPFPEYFGIYEYIRVVAPPTATFDIASEVLTCIEETSPASFGSDEVGLRIVTVPIELNGTLGAFRDHKF